MQEVGVDISRCEAREMKESFREHFAFVVTLSDDSQERSPVWPFTRNIVHWNLPDPASVDGPLERKKAMFRSVRDGIARRVDEFAQEVAPTLQGRRRELGKSEIRKSKSENENSPQRAQRSQSLGVFLIFCRGS